MSLSTTLAATLLRFLIATSLPSPHSTLELIPSPVPLSILNVLDLSSSLLGLSHAKFTPTFPVSSTLIPCPPSIVLNHPQIEDHPDVWIPTNILVLIPDILPICLLILTPVESHPTMPSLIPSTMMTKLVQTGNVTLDIVNLGRENPTFTPLTQPHIVSIIQTTPPPIPLPG